VRAGGCPVVVAQWESTGYQVFWVGFGATAGLFTFLYFDLETIHDTLSFIAMSLTSRWLWL